MYRFAVRLSLGLALLLAAQPAQCITLKSGEIIVAGSLTPASQAPDFALLAVDPATGDRTILSSDTVGAGPSFNFPPSETVGGAETWSVHYEADGALLVAENALGGNGVPSDSRIYRVDPTTGNRTLISTSGYDTAPTGNAGPFVGLYYDAREFGSGVLVTGQGNNFALINVATGDRTLFPAGGGSGPAPTATGFAIAGTNVYFGNEAPATIMKLDTLTGARSIISGSGVGTGHALTLPTDVLIDGAGNLFVLDNLQELLRIDPVTGNRTVVSDPTVGSGPAFSAFMLAQAANGTLLTVTFGLSAAGSQVMSIDPLTGARAIVSSAALGTGPTIYRASGITVVPEPSAWLLAVLGSLALFTAKRSRG